MSSAKADADSPTKLIGNAISAIPSPSEGQVTAPPQIHVHHFHHQSCRHRSGVPSGQILSGSPNAPLSNDDYAVVLNSNSMAHSPFRAAFLPQISKNPPTAIFSSPRKTFCTATIRHPSLAPLVLHRPRIPLTADNLSTESPGLCNVNITCHAFASSGATQQVLLRNHTAEFPGGTVSSRGCPLQLQPSGATPGVFLPQNIARQSTSQKNASSRAVAANCVPGRTNTLGPGDRTVYYRLTNNCIQNDLVDHHHHQQRQQRICQNLPESSSSNNLTDRLLRWFRPGGFGTAATNGGSPGATALDMKAESSHTQRRRSKSQPPQHSHQQRRVHMIQINPRCMPSTVESASANRPRNEPKQDQRPIGLATQSQSSSEVCQALGGRRRQLPPTPCTCSHHNQAPQVSRPPKQTTSSSSTPYFSTNSCENQQRCSRFPRWLFPCAPQPKHSLSPTPPAPCSPCVVPPPPPPRSAGVKSKPPTRSVEVQTQPELMPACCCASGLESTLLGLGDVTGTCCCSGEHRQHIMLHHYHFHHYYHCDAQPPVVGTTAATELSSAGPPVDSRPPSPLIKLSVTWPPHETETPEEGRHSLQQPVEENVRMERAEVSGLEACAAPTANAALTPEGEPPAPVSEALSAIESAVVETPTALLTRPNFQLEEGDKSRQGVSDRTLVPGDQNQQDQRRIFLQNINQLKRTGWYWGPLTIEEAELLLKDRPNGSFLVRDSGHELYILSVSFRAENRTYHTRIEHTGGKFGFAVQGDADTTSPSIAQFINHVIAESERGRTRFFLRQSALTTSGHQPAVAEQAENDNHHVEARLLYPVSRFLVVHSLAHLCRFEILLKVRKDHVDSLPLPDRLKRYLHERQYYTEFVQAYLDKVGRLPNTLPPNITESLGDGAAERV